MRLKEIRKNVGASPQQLAELLGISVQSYYRYENGQNEPSLPALIKLADYFGVSLDYLCGRNFSAISQVDETDVEILDGIKKLSSQQKERVIGYIACLHGNN